MKNIATLLIAILIYTISNSQSSGNIQLLNSKATKGVSNTYKYIPPSRLALPSRLYVSLVFMVNEEYRFKRILLDKQNDYQFKFQAPDSSSVLIANISDEKYRAVDNNNELGYILYLHDGTGAITPAARLDAVYLLSDYATRVLQLNYEKLKPVMIHLYEEAYKLSPNLKNATSYTYYLTLLSEEKGEAIRPKILQYAKRMAASENNESHWDKAISAYKILKMYEAASTIEQKAVTKYPNGKIAAENYIKNMPLTDTTENLTLAAMTDYKTRFGDSSVQMKYTFYGQLISILLQNNVSNRLDLYESHMPNQPFLAGWYDNWAVILSGGDTLENSGSDLQSAKTISRKSLAIIESLKNAFKDLDEDDGTLSRIHHKSIDTYSRILYKSGQYDSAFYYKDKDSRETNDLDASDVEILVTYAEKVKGPEAAFQILSEYILSGVSSESFISRLNLLKEKSGFADSTFENLKSVAMRNASEDSKKRIIKVFGTSKSKNFVLKNLNGKTVSLASFKGKIVVLDFWATWCLPCRASFPRMKEMVNQYKNDAEIVFLFIDTWERKPAARMQSETSKFLKDADYNFEVLLDINDRVALAYKAEYIPATFIIDRNGNIVFMGESSNLVLEIEKVKHEVSKMAK